MRALRWLCSVAASVPLVASGASQVVSHAPDSVALTVYRHNSIPTYLDAEGGIFEGGADYGLAMVSESRTIELAAGESTIVFRAVADGIAPQTVAIEGLPAQLAESNFDYDLLAPGTLIEKSLGRVVRVVSTDRASGRQTERRATLLSGPRGVVLDYGESVEALDCSGNAEKLIFDDIPEALTAEPTLSVRVHAPAAGIYKVRVSYLSVGMYWVASYRAQIQPNGRTLDLVGWLTLINPLSTSFANAPTRVVAGELSRSDDTVPPGATMRAVSEACWPIGVPWLSAEDIGRFPDADVAEALQRAQGFDGDNEEIVVTGIRASLVHPNEIADYKLYTVPEPTTVEAQQAKQVMLLQKEDVPFERVYRYTIDDDILYEDSSESDHPQTLLRLENRKSAGLGIAIPAGVVAVIEPGPAGQPIVVGEHEITDTPVGLPLELELGRAPGIWVRSRLLRSRERDRDEHIYMSGTVEVVVHNDKSESAIVEVRHRPLYSTFRLRKASRRFIRKSGDPTWIFELPPGGNARFTYSFDATL
ncbi:MAG: hypothetical protein GX535_14270 [Xanthomonadaceae bacterium]|nr:hypothetical protein [Xanthomonadaceae bacterium]